jgi:hypothetical protein
LAILFTFLLLLNQFTEDGHAEDANQADMHVGEDGVAYPLGDQIERSNWMLGKIEPILYEASQTEDELSIIIVFKRRTWPMSSIRSRQEDRKIRGRLGEEGGLVELVINGGW